MARNTFTGTAGNDLLDASAEDARDTAVFRAGAGHDTCIGGAGNDRFDGGAGADSLFGGGGADQFFIARDNVSGGARDSIDGGTGTDLLNIAISSTQLTDAVKAEIARLADYLAGDTTQRFTSDIFHVDMVDVETANLRVDGVIKTLAEVAAPPPPPPVGVSFETVSSGASPPITENGFVFSGVGTTIEGSFLVGLFVGASPDGGQALKAYGTTSITRSDQADFAVDLVNTTMYGTGNTGHIQGFNGGTKLYDVTVQSGAWQDIPLQWTGLDEVRLIADTTTNAPIYTDGWVFH